MRTALALIVTPFSRSSSMVSRNWLRTSRAGDGAGALEEAVGEGGFAVVDVGDDREVANAIKLQDATIVTFEFLLPAWRFSKGEGGQMSI